MGKKLLKVTMEYDDGEIQTLEGEQAQQWEKELNGAVTMNWVHGHHMPQFKWKKIKKKK